MVGGSSGHGIVLWVVSWHRHMAYTTIAGHTQPLLVGLMAVSLRLYYRCARHDSVKHRHEVTILDAGPPTCRMSAMTGEFLRSRYQRLLLLLVYHLLCLPSLMPKELSFRLRRCHFLIFATLPIIIASPIRRDDFDAFKFDISPFDGVHTALP